MRQLVAFATIFAVFALLQCLSLVSGGPIVERLPQPRLYNLGTVEGKSYFYDNSTARDWSTAKAYCTGLGMRLATINTSAQQTFLQGKYSAQRFAGGFWIGARDARNINQFAWDVNNSAVTNIGQTWNFQISTPQTCVYYCAIPGTDNGRWDTYLCSSSAPYVLCET